MADRRSAHHSISVQDRLRHFQTIGNGPPPFQSSQSAPALTSAPNAAVQRHNRHASMENVVPVRSMLKQWSHNDKPSLGPDSDAREYTATGAVVCEGRLQRQIGSIGRSPRHCELRDDPALLLFSASLPRKLLSEIFLEPRLTVIDCDEAGTLTLSRLPKERNRDQAGTVRLKDVVPERIRRWAVVPKLCIKPKSNFF